MLAITFMHNWLMQMIVCNTQIRCEGEWSSYSRTVSVPTADHDVDRDQSEIFTFVSHEIEEEAIFVELLSGSVAEKFDDFLNSKRASEENQQRDGKRHAPSASAPPFTEMEAELRYVQTLPPGEQSTRNAQPSINILFHKHQDEHFLFTRFAPLQFNIGSYIINP